MRSHAPPAAITELAIGIESMRLPSGPLSEPPFFAPGTLNCTTASLYLAPGGDGRSVLYRTGVAACILMLDKYIFKYVPPDGSGRIGALVSE